MTVVSTPPPPRPAWSAGHARWGICALLFFASAINYVDRQVIGILKPTLQREFGWSELDYGDIIFSFQLAYALGFLVAGPIVDRLGTKRGYSLAIAIWSVAALAHAEATTFGPAIAATFALFGLTYAASVAGFMAARFALGLGESGNFPAAIKAVAEWFPKRERALATGIFNAGTNVGALVTPLVVPWITLTYGWYWAFVVTGGLGFAWLLWWWRHYDAPENRRGIGARELAYIRSDPAERPEPVAWVRLLTYRQTWAMAIAKFLTDPIWWLYLFWIPDFLNRAHGVDLRAIGLPLIVIYVVADVGSVGGGWLSSWLIGRGWTVNAARKIAMLTCALAVTPIVFAARVQSLWLAVAIVAVAAAAHQGWSANLYTIATDMFPRRAIGSIIGFSGMTAAVGGMLIAKVTASVLEFTGSYVPVFIVAGVAYLTALAIVHAIVPKLEPAKID